MFSMTAVRPALQPLALASCLVCASPALSQELVNLTFESPTYEADIGDPVLVKIMVGTDGADQQFLAMDAILQWDPSVLQLIDADPDDSEWFWSAGGLLNNPDGINDTYADGDAIVTLLGSPLFPPTAPGAPDLLWAITVQFQAIGEGVTQIAYVDAIGIWSETQVLPAGPGNVTGDISSLATVTVVDPNAVPCPADLNGDGIVGSIDLLVLLAAWLTNPGGPPDFNGDGIVNVNDLLEMLGAWGACP